LSARKQGRIAHCDIGTDHEHANRVRRQDGPAFGVVERTGTHHQASGRENDELATGDTCPAPWVFVVHR
jgi:hypothetical protein